MIRPAERRDLERVLEIERGSFDDPWTGQAFEAFLGQPAVRFAVADEGAVDGYIIYSLVCGEAEIYNIAVAPESRRRGLGRELLGAALENAGTAFLDVRAGNLPAIALYRGFGFKEIGLRKKYYGNGDDAVLMKWSR